MLPGRDDDLGAVGVNVVRGQRIDARRRSKRPVRANGVVALLESGQTLPALSGIVVELPVDLLALQGLVEALQEAELGRRAIADTDMAEVLGDMGAEALGEERGAIVGDQERWSLQLAMERLGPGPCLVDRLANRGRRLAGGEMAGEQVA